MILCSRLEASPKNIQSSKRIMLASTPNISQRVSRSGQGSPQLAALAFAQPGNFEGTDEFGKNFKVPVRASNCKQCLGKNHNPQGHGGAREYPTLAGEGSL